MTCSASVLSNAALATDRYLAFTSSTVRKLSSSTAIAVSIAIWSFSISVPLLYFATGFYMLAFIYANTAIIITLFLLLFYFVRIVRSLHVHDKHMKTVLRRGTQRQSLIVEKKATKSFQMILVLFFLCTFPSCVMIYIINLCQSCDCDVIHWLRDLQYLLLLVNSSCNQFLYAWRMQSFRRAFEAIHLIFTARFKSKRKSTISPSFTIRFESVQIEKT